MDAPPSGWELWPAWLLAALVLARATPALRRHLSGADAEARRVLLAAVLALAAMRHVSATLGRRVGGSTPNPGRGAAAGALEAGLDALRGAGATSDSVWVHFGPAICGECYEVGPEVFEALGLPVPEDRMLDLRAALLERAVAAGVPRDQVSRSEWCTRCDGEHLYSHRAGSTRRQIGFLAIRSEVAR